MKTHIILHHSLTKDSDTVSWAAITEYHKSLGWKDNGYHFGIELVPRGEYAIMIGRHLEARAAAVKEENMNARGIHICVIGNFDLDVVPEPQWNLAAYVTAILCRTKHIPLANVMGHRDFRLDKSCPGKKFRMDYFRHAVELQLGGVT